MMQYDQSRFSDILGKNKYSSPELKVESPSVLCMEQKENRPEVIYINKNILDFGNIHIIFS